MSQTNKQTDAGSGYDAMAPVEGGEETNEGGADDPEGISPEVRKFRRRFLVALVLRIPTLVIAMRIDAFS